MQLRRLADLRGCSIDSPDEISWLQHERRLGILDHLEQTLTANLHRATGRRQTTLNKVFLVPAEN